MNRFVLALAVLAACDDGTDTDTNDTNDTGPTTPTDCPNGNFQGDTQVESVTVDCNTSGEGVLGALLTGVSAPGSAVMFIQETGSSYAGGQWAEEHHLDELSSDPCLASEELGQVIETVDLADVDDYVDGSASVFDCAGHFEDPNFITAAVFVVDADDSSVTSCLAVGDDPQGLINGDYDGDNVGVQPSFDLSGCDVGT